MRSCRMQDPRAGRQRDAQSRRADQDGLAMLGRYALLSGTRLMQTFAVRQRSEALCQAAQIARAAGREDIAEQIERIDHA
jgi:propanediol dehydratase small subunit